MKHSAQLVMWGVAAALALPGLAGCGRSASTTPANPTPHPLSVSATLPDGLLATVAEDRASVPVGGTVTYTMTLANATAQPITFRTLRGGMPSAGVGDALSLLDARGNIVYPQGVFKLFIYRSPLITLVPRQSMSGTLAVGADKYRGQIASAGRYTATMSFDVESSSGMPASATARPLIVDAQ